MKATHANVIPLTVERRAPSRQDRFKLANVTLDSINPVGTSEVNEGGLALTLSARQRWCSPRSEGNRKFRFLVVAVFCNYSPSLARSEATVQRLTAKAIEVKGPMKANREARPVSS